MISMCCFEDFLENFANVNLKKILQNFKEIVAIDETKLSQPTSEFSEVLKQKVEEVVVKSREFLRHTEETLTTLYYVNNALFYVEDFVKNTKEMCKKIFSVVVKKVFLILNENIKRHLTGDKSKVQGRSVLIFCRYLFKWIEGEVAAILKALATIMPNGDILSSETIASFEEINDKIYEMCDEFYEIKVRDFFANFQVLMVKCLVNLENGQSYNIESEKNLIESYFGIIKKSKTPKMTLIAQLNWLFSGIWLKVHALIGKIYSENSDKSLVKLLTNVCWNCYHLIYFVEAWSYDYLMNRNWEKDIDTSKIEEYISNLQTNKEFLSKKIFENLNTHLSTILVDKKIVFISFFVDGEKRKLFKSIGTNLKDKAPHDVFLLLAGLFVKKHSNLLKQFFTIEQSSESAVKFITENNLEKYLNYV